MTLRKLIHNAARPSRMEWLFNNLRLLHTIPGHRRSLLPTGTTANEALHAEINSWFRNQSDIFSTTVSLQLSVAILGKQLAHSSSLFHPTLRQMRHQDVLGAVVGILKHSARDWESYCTELSVEGNRVKSSQLPLARQRAEISARIRSAAGQPSSKVVKKPAGPHDKLLSVLKRPCKSSKRTAFTLSRPESLARVAAKKK